MKFIQKIKQKLLTKWFTEWVNTEEDLETLSMTSSMITAQEQKIKILNDAKNRVTIHGYRRDNGPI